VQVQVNDRVVPPSFFNLTENGHKSNIFLKKRLQQKIPAAAFNN